MPKGFANHLLRVASVRTQTGDIEKGFIAPSEDLPLLITFSSVTYCESRHLVPPFLLPCPERHFQCATVSGYLCSPCLLHVSHVTRPRTSIPTALPLSHHFLLCQVTKTTITNWIARVSKHVRILSLSLKSFYLMHCFPLPRG